MTNDNDGSQEPPGRRMRRPSAAELALTFGLTEDAAERLLRRPPNETCVLMTIAAILAADMRPEAEAKAAHGDPTLDGPRELLALYTRMGPEERGMLLSSARALAAAAATALRRPTKD